MNVIEVEQLSYTYAEGTPALREVTFSLAHGETVGLIGPNGAGKSTLLLHLNGLLQGKGEVRVGGLSTRNGPLREIRRRVGLVFQDPDDQLFMPSVRDDVAFGPLHLGLPEEEALARVDWALDQVGMQGVENRSPHHLSFGERKRVALATVLAMEPEVLVLDEPTANLDPRARRQLLNLLPTLPQTKLLATHDLEAVVELCERVLLLDQGQIFADGPPAEILRDASLLAAHGLEVPLSYSLTARSETLDPPTGLGFAPCGGQVS